MVISYGKVDTLLRVGTAIQQEPDHRNLTLGGGEFARGHSFPPWIVRCHASVQLRLDFSYIACTCGSYERDIMVVLNTLYHEDDKNQNTDQAQSNQNHIVAAR